MDFPTSDPVVMLPLVPEASCPSPGPEAGRAGRGALPLDRSEEPPAGEGRPEAGWAPAPGSGRPSSSHTPLDTSDTDLEVGTSPRGSCQPACWRPGTADSGPPDTADRPGRGLALLPSGLSQAPRGEDARVLGSSASGLSPASQSDREPELSDSCTRIADTFWNSGREGQDRLLMEEGARDPAEDAEQVPGADTDREPGAAGAKSWGRGLPCCGVGGTASSAAAGAAERGRWGRRESHTCSPSRVPELRHLQPALLGPSARGSEPENPGRGRRNIHGRRSDPTRVAQPPPPLHRTKPRLGGRLRAPGCGGGERVAPTQLWEKPGSDLG